MTSPSTTASSSSLVSRVTLVTALASAIAGLLSAVISLVVADRLVTNTEDVRLRSTAAIVLRELPAVADGTDVETQRIRARAAVEEEAEELSPEIRLAVRVAGTKNVIIGGDEQLAAVEPGACESHDSPPRRAAGESATATTTTSTTTTTTQRVCALEANHYRVVVAANRSHSGVGLIPLACLVASIVVGIVAALLARRMAAWALAPLTRLRATLDTVNLDAESLPELPSASAPLARLGDDNRCTEVAEVRTAIDSLIGRLALSLNSARRFSADAAHELKTPLTVLLAEIDLLAEEHALDEETRSVVSHLRLRVKSLTRLVERLLVLSMASSGMLTKNVVVSIEDVTRDVIGGLAPHIRRRVELKADSVGNVRGDEVLLSAAIENAIDNALKFSAPPSDVADHQPPDVEVTISEPDDAEVVQVDVRDSGPGVPLEYRERAFEAFFRTPESRGKSGTPGHGIGLALVAQIALAHLGTASFVDLPAGEHGAHLRLTLPIWKARSTAMKAT